MSKFLQIPSYYMVPDGKGSWISAGDLVFHSSLLNQDILIPKGSHNNLASIPKPLRSFFPVNGPRRLAAALHDGIYEKQGKVQDVFRNPLILSRADGDLVFKEAMLTTRELYWNAIPADLRDYLTNLNRHVDFKDRRETLVSYPKAELFYQTVKTFGSFYW